MLDTALALDDKDPRLSDGVGNMLCPDSSIEDVPRFKEGAVLYTSTSIAHLDAAIEDRKDLLSSIHMPLVWLIRPMKARGDPAHIGNVRGAPRAICFEGASAKYFHAVSDT